MPRLFGMAIIRPILPILITRVADAKDIIMNYTILLLVMKMRVRLQERVFISATLAIL